mgnify:CR=1 FL=1
MTPSSPTSRTRRPTPPLDWDFDQDFERLTTGGTASYSPLANLTNRLTVGYDFSNQETRLIRPVGFPSQPQGTAAS